MAIKKPRRNTDYRKPEEFLNTLKQSNRELTALELSWELRCDPQTTRNKLRELLDEGLIIERCEGGKQRPQRFYRATAPQLNNSIIEVEG